MGKIRTRTIGSEEVEDKQKKEQKQRSQEKKQKKVQDEKTEKQVTQEKEAATKEKKKTSAEKSETKVKVHVQGKNYKKAKKSVDDKKLYSIEEAVTLLKKIKYAAFDESVELHLNVLEEGLKGEVSLPYGIGKKINIKIVDDNVLKDIENGRIDFDILITHPSFMPKLAKFARVLGPKGLMPNPKAGTISPNPEETAKKFSQGLLRWKAEAKFPLVHQMVGKISFADKDLNENILVFLKSVSKSKIKEAYVKTTMSPSIKLDLEKM